jgi:hypothetical protein
MREKKAPKGVRGSALMMRRNLPKILRGAIQTRKMLNDHRTSDVGNRYFFANVKGPVCKNQFLRGGIEASSSRIAEKLI